MDSINSDEFLNKTFIPILTTACIAMGNIIAKILSMEDTPENGMEVQTVQVMTPKKEVFDFIHVLCKKFKPLNKFIQEIEILSTIILN